MRSILILLGLASSSVKATVPQYTAIHCLSGDKFGNSNSYELVADSANIQFLGNGNLTVLGNIIEFRKVSDPTLTECRYTYKHCQYYEGYPEIAGGSGNTYQCKKLIRSWNVLKAQRTNQTTYLNCTSGSRALSTSNAIEVHRIMYRLHYGDGAKTISKPSCILSKIE